MRREYLHVFIACVILLFAHGAIASLVAYDSAGDSAYNSVGISDSILGINGGYGWGGPWQADPRVGFLNGISAHAYMGSSTQFGGGDINSPQVRDGRAWELGGRAFQGVKNSIIRPFSGALAPGQTFFIDYANGPFHDSGGGAYPGVILGNVGVTIGNGTTDWPEYTNIDYEVISGLSRIDTGIRVTDQGIHIELSVLDPTHAQFSVTALAPGGRSATVPVPYTAVSSVQIVNTGSTGGIDSVGDMFFNNVAIAPEPSFSFAIGFGIVAALTLTRKPIPGIR